MPLSFWSLGSGLIWSLVVNSLLGIWPLCLATPWPFSCRSWCLWWSLSCCRFLWPLSRRINEVFNDQNDDWLSENGIKEVADGSINFEDVTFCLYRVKMATRPMFLQGINLSIRSGEVIGILGGTGSGEIKLGSVDSSSLWCWVWSNDSGRPRCQRIRSWFLP